MAERDRTAWPSGLLMLLCLAGWVLGASSVAADEADSPRWEAEAMEWREQRLARLTAPFGWLSLVALEFLGDGEWTVGAGADNDVRLISGPDRWGTLRLQGAQARFAPARGAEVFVGDRALDTAIDLTVAGDQPATRVSAGTGWFEMASRGDRLVLRARDSEAETRTDFLGLDYFEFDPAWRVEARWEPHPEGATIPIADVLGELRDQPNPGRAVFEVNGQQFALEALAAEDQLFFILADRTSGRETYGLGRFLYSAMPEDGRVVLDFNRSYNPPCAFNAYTTCPLPPPENRLDVRVEAGERRYQGGGGIQPSDLDS
ncbi:DUF1684 domain-containing protein [Wenzhouxiangella limi]|uniref:DUF1684 domain-containing protein n=1 Tax=Wenzhouxiangella limi TaxID=2707351 RepID=A0A845V6F1_9GAMM|nr:DUF1684 domain-containing protein [Wenzhouxiangella limi]NDY96746.1 DUF1684 domain-containing protein [Wenzhouxiangella limi]